MADLIHKKLAYDIIGCAMEVHRVLGPGFLESVYEQGMLVELQSKGLNTKQQVLYPIFYKGVHIKDYVADLVVENKIIIELKAIKKLSDIERAQCINYLKVSGLELALLINFGERSLEYERIILTQNNSTY